MATEVGDKNKVVLYNNYSSSCSTRVRIILNLKGIEYEYRPPHSSHPNGYTDEELTKLNMRGQVPILVIDGVVLSESVAIAEYLEETRPQPALLPPSPRERAIVRKYVERVNAGIQPLQNLSLLERVREKCGDEERVAWGAHWINKGLTALEGDIKQTAGKYCLGDQLTLADVFLLPQLLNAPRFNVDLAQHPTLSRIQAHLEALPAFEAAHPSRQIDAPK